MLKDLMKEDWLSMLNLPEERIPQVLILRGTRWLKGQYDRHKAMLTDVIEVGAPNLIIDDVLVGRYQGVEVGYASVYGDAMAAAVTHFFGVLGTLIVIQTGCCGALDRSINIGDLICATTATCGEGAAQYYRPGAKAITASQSLVDAIAESVEFPVALHCGPVITTSALLAESREDIARWHQQGHLGVDMETATTFAVAEHFGMQRASLLYVFDNPAQGEHILLADEERWERRRLGEKAMLEIVFSFIASTPCNKVNA
jgi:purine-nucleoside phosphorylase